MCYGYRPVYTQDGRLLWVSPHDYERGKLIGKYFDPPHPFIYPFQESDVLNGDETESMQFDLLPRFFLQQESLPLSDVLKKKKSRRIDPITGKSIGFSSFNARFETIEKLPSFKNPWLEGRRCAIPVSAFLERPNREDAPPEMRNREVMVQLREVAYLGAIWDTWRGPNGESLRSFALVTIDSSSSAFFQSIWHERMPVLLTPHEATQWLDPDTPLERIRALCDPYPDECFSLGEKE